jgi:hypothetical protein
MTELTNRLFVSEEKRLTDIKRLRDRGRPFFESISFDGISPFLHFKLSVPRVARNLIMTQLYHQPKTDTYVHHLREPLTKTSIVMKTYRLRGSQEINVPGAIKQHDIEIRYLRLLAEFVLHDITPHVTLPIGRTILNRDETSSLLVQDVPDGSYHVILSEFVETSLTPLARTLTKYQIKSLLFQTVYTLAAIQNTFPSFRHNDLHLSNVLVQSIDGHGLKKLYPGKQLCTRYKLGKHTFYHNINLCPYRALLWDLYFSSINAEDASLLGLTQVVNDSFVKTGMSTRNQYYDLHKLFDSLEYVMAKRSMSTDLRDLIDYVVPTKYKCMSKGLNPEQKRKLDLSDINVTNPLELLCHPYFAELMEMPVNSVIIKKYVGTKNPFV